jgi:hypothetical protein
VLKQTLLRSAPLRIASNLLQETDYGGGHEGWIMTFRQRCDASHCLRPATPGFNPHLPPAVKSILTEDLVRDCFSRAGI